MSRRREYPRLGERLRLKPTSEAQCCVCGAKAYYRLDIEINWFRGDDVVVKVCTAHSIKSGGEAATWLLTELDPDEPTRAFGLCDLGMGFPELGYVDLDELAQVKRMGLGVERDRYFSTEIPLSKYAAEAASKQRIVA